MQWRQQCSGCSGGSNPAVAMEATISEVAVEATISEVAVEAAVAMEAAV